MTHAGYIIAGAAIWAAGRTEQDALAAYRRDTGDDTLTLDTISRNPREGKTYIVPATADLLHLVERVGGDIVWDVVDGVATIPAEEEA